MISQGYTCLRKDRPSLHLDIDNIITSKATGRKCDMVGPAPYTESDKRVFREHVDS